MCPTKLLPHLSGTPYMVTQNMLTNARRHNTFVMIWVYTDAVAFQVKSVLAIFDVLEFIFVEIRPPP